VVASRSWSRLIPAGIVAAVLTGVSQGAWHGIWTWWAPMMVLLALTLLFARFPPVPWRRAAATDSRSLDVGPLGYFDAEGDEAERAGDGR
jgi:hypothetical protein